jgi:hypothetical protein
MDIAEQKVVQSRKNSGKGTTASAKGAAGHAMGVVFVKEAQKAAEQEVKQRESMKDKLKRLTALDRESHLEFRKVLAERVQQITDVAKGMGISLTEYLRGDGISASVYASLSMWAKMSRACETGWKPDMALPWAEISVAATDALAAKASTGENGETQTANPTKRKGRPQKTLMEKVKALLEDQPLQEIEKVHAMIGTMIAAKKAKKGAPKNKGAANEEQQLQAA